MADDKACVKDRGRKEVEPYRLFVGLQRSTVYDQRELQMRDEA